VHRYLTHPQVRIEPDVPVPEWGLSDTGRGRAERLAAAGWLAGTRRIVSSAETKAIETAEILARALGIDVEIRPGMHENDRSATGFLKGPEFEEAADRFFAEPDRSVRGWERAADAQARIVREVAEALAGGGDGGVLFVGHGGVGTLLLCHIAALAIDRRHDQPAGGGNHFGFAFAPAKVHHRWRRLEEPPPVTAG
jgi:broad specificity phosphatase PhoE